MHTFAMGSAKGTAVWYRHNQLCYWMNSVKVKVAVPRFVYVSVNIVFYDYTMRVECFLLASLYLVALLNSEQCSQFERFHLRHVQIVNKHPVSKQNLLTIMLRLKS